MKTYLANIIPRIQRFSQKLDNLTLLLNQHWVIVNELENTKYVYIFRDNNELLISKNGKVDKGKWEYLGENSLLIDLKNESYLYRHGFFDSNILALKVDGLNEYAFLVNENKYGGDLNSIEEVFYFLESKYIKMIPNPKYGDKYYFQESATQIENLKLDKNLNPVGNDNLEYGYMDKSGKLIIPYRYSGAYDFCEGLARVFQTKNNSDFYGFIDEAGEEVIPLKYEFGDDFSEGLAVVRLNRKFGFIDKKGNIKIEFKFDDADSFDNGKARVSVRNHHFYIDNTGNEI